MSYEHQKIASILLLGLLCGGVGGSCSFACPPNAIPIAAGMTIQDAVDRAKENAVFCLKPGVHRLQVARPKQGQSFQGDGQAIMNGARILTGFHKEGALWAVAHTPQIERRAGECAENFPTCDFPVRIFINDNPLRRVLEKSELRSGFFYIDNRARKLFLADDPEGKSIEESIARFAFESFAPNVSIKNLVVEKYASPAQEAAINGRHGKNWSVENCEIRFNSGVGVGLGTDGVISGSNIHHNGQIGAVMVGMNVVFKGNELWANNVSGFDPLWEGGGIKISQSDRVIMADNHVHHNAGPGLWCDIDCRNVTYEGNTVEYNDDAGIFHEISFKAIIRNNKVRYNGLNNSRWYWGGNIQIAASENVDVYDNHVETRKGGTAIILIDQSRQRTPFIKYKTQNNRIHGNVVEFTGSGNSGGASDAREGDENYSIIEIGGNLFESNTYRIHELDDSVTFVWGHNVYDWDGFRNQKKQEKNGQFLKE